jgi:hypothetical protein
MSTDLTQSWNQANTKIDAINTYNQSKSGEESIKKSLGQSTSKAISKTASQLNKLASKQKRFEREVPTSMDQMVNLLAKTGGQGSATFRFLRRKLLETVTKIEPDIKRIIQKNALKALGCSTQQTFKGFSLSQLNNLQSLNQLPVQQGIYIPVSSLDFVGNLKKSIDSPIGKTYYEKPIPEVKQGVFKPYLGSKPYPMNKELNLRMESNNLNKSYKSEFGKYYQGVSGQELFDFEYTKTNEFGVSGDYYKMILVDREDFNITGGSANKVGDFLTDYYSTIKLLDSTNFLAYLVNLISGAVSIKSELGQDDINEQSKFSLLIQRILGLCFDNRSEIDVSGISKIAELDGVDDEFFEFTEVDLRNIELRLNNIQNGVMEFEDCDNVKLPVDADTLVEEINKFRDDEENQSLNQQVDSMERVLDTIHQNPDWKVFLPTNFNAEIAINKNIIKQIPLAVASVVLSPKVLLPIYTMISVLETSAKNTINQSITQVNNNITQANNNINQANSSVPQVNNVINNGVDFVKKFRKFVINVVAEIGSIFLETLFDLLKRDIIQLLNEIIKDIEKAKAAKKYTIILRLVQIAIAVDQLVSNYAKCKSLINDILTILNLINNTIKPGGGIPSFLMPLTALLPGTDPNRASLNTIEFLQELGVPTGTLPDGSPNVMLLFNKAMHKGSDKEEAENGGLDAQVIVPPLTGGILSVNGKKK